MAEEQRKRQVFLRFLLITVAVAPVAFKVAEVVAEVRLAMVQVAVLEASVVTAFAWL